MPVYVGAGSRSTEYVGAGASPVPYVGAGSLFGSSPPTWVANTAFGSGTTSATINFNTTGRQSGDFLVVQVETANRAVTMPSDWWPLLSSPQGTGTAGAAGAVRVTLFGKITDGTQTTAVVTCSGGDHVSVIGLVYRGIDPAWIGNLVPNSNDFTNTTYWTTYGNGTGGTVSISTSVIAGPGGGAPGCRLQLTSPTGAQADSVGIYTASYPTLKPSTTYTILMYARGTSATQKFALSGYVYDGSDHNNISSDITVTTTWTRQKFTFTTLSSFSYTNIAVIPDAALDSTDIQIAQFMLIEGDVDINTTYIPTTSAPAAVFNCVNASTGTTQSASTSFVCPGPTSTVDNCLVAVHISNDRDLASTTNLSSPANAALTGVTLRADQTISTGAGGGVGLITGVKASAGAIGNTTVTNAASNTNASITLALAPPP